MGTKTLLTLEDFERLPDDENLYELSEGELVSVTRPVLRHMLAAKRVQTTLDDYVRPKELGVVFAEGSFLLAADPPTLRVPDAAFVSQERLSRSDVDRWVEGAPELAVEIISPSQTALDVEKKTLQYLAAGARLVWIIYPETRTVHVYQADGPPCVLTANDMLDARDLFPGWSVRVADLLL